MSGAFSTAISDNTHCSRKGSQDGTALLKFHTLQRPDTLPTPNDHRADMVSTTTRRRLAR